MFQQFNVSCFRAEGEVGHKAQQMQRPHAAEGEFPGGVHRAAYRQFHHKVRAALYGQLRSRKLVQDGRFAPLGKVSAHHANNGPGRKFSADRIDQILVPVVERVEFGDDACDGHISPSPPGTCRSAP